MKTKYKAYLQYIFLIIFSTITPCQARNSKYLEASLLCLSNNEWEFIEQVFITNPEINSQKKTNIITLASITLSSILNAIWIKNSTIEHIEQYINTVKENDIPALWSALTPSLMGSILGPIFSLIIPSITIHKISQYLINNNENFLALKDFIITWPHNKNQTPEIFHKIFDTIHKKYTEDASDDYLQKICPEVIEKIKEKIYEQLPQKYSNRLQKKSIGILLTTCGLTTLGVALLIKLTTGSIRDIVEIINICNHAMDPENLLVVPVQPLERTTQETEPPTETPPTPPQKKRPTKKHKRNFSLAEDSPFNGLTDE